nr:uncharacterized protein LOC111429379 [Onthophagus taurus]
MNDHYISKTHISKLDHKLLEVRERALKNILSKIQIGLPYDNVYARQQEILTKCFNLFEFDDCSMKNFILELIGTTLKSETGQLLINHFGSKEIIKSLLNVRVHVNGCLVNEVDELIKYVENKNQSVKALVPPLVSEIPLSYRSDCEAVSKVGSTATSINIFVHNSPENEQQSPLSQSSNLLNCDLFYCVQPLVETDTHILESVEASLKSGDEDELSRTCYFFMDILIRDFSPQVFLQLRTILKELENIFISNDSSEIKLIVAKLTLVFKKQIFEKAEQELKNECACDKNTVIIYCLQNLQWSLEEFLSVNGLGSNLIHSEKLHLYMVLLQLIYDLVHITNQFFQANKKLLNLLNKTLNKFAQVICKISLSIICADYNQQLYIIYISLIITFLNISKLLLPSNSNLYFGPVKEVLITIASDVTIMLFYPQIYDEVLEYAQLIKLENLNNYLSLKDIYASFLTAVKLLRTKTNEACDIKEFNMDDIKLALKTWTFYKDMRIANIFLENTVQDDDFNEMLCSLLAHKDIGLKLKMYKMLLDKFTKTMGPNMCIKSTILKNSNIEFLLNCKIFNKIILEGLSSLDNDVRQTAENILLIVFKSSTVVSESIWRKVLEIILLTFPALACFAKDTSSLGQLVLDIVDPDRGQSMGMTLDSIFKSNLSLLFSRHASVRNEAISRLCWLLSIQLDHNKLLPRLNYVSNKLHNVCFAKYQVDVNHLPAYTKTYHQQGVLEKLLKLLYTANLEPLIKRSTLTQLAVIIEDYALHKEFLELDGIQKMVALLKDSLLEKNYETYPDCALSLITILKYLALYNSSVRQNLGCDEIVYYIFRAMLLYRTDDRLLHDGSTLIFCLLYNNYLKGSVIQANLSLPNIILQNLQVPFSCVTFQNNSDDFSDFNIWTKNDNEKQFSLKLMWNFAWFNNKTNIMDWNISNDFNLDLCLSEKELKRVQNSSLEFCFRKCLNAIQSDYYNEFVKLIGILHLYRILTPKYATNIDFFSSPSTMILERLFYSACPNEDELRIMMECLALLIPLNNNNLAIYDCLLQNQLMFTQGEKNGLDVEFFRLITTCMKHNKNSYYNGFEVVNLISECLSCDVQGFYNLALLDSMLTCLTQITLNPGWSQLSDNRDTKLFNICYNLGELIATFNTGKGENASESVMGSAIIKNAILSLCHILHEMISWNIENWEYYFIEKESGINRNLVNLFLLFESKDVTIRAGVFQLFTGLFLSIDCINELTENLHYNLRELLFSILIDKYESVLVKEHVANALYNYISTLFRFKIDMLLEIPNILISINFFSALTSMLDLCVSNESTVRTPIIAVGCLKSLLCLIGKLFQVFSTSLNNHFNDIRLLKLFLRLLIVPNTQKLSTTRDLEHYRYVIELDIAVCNFLIQLYETNGLQIQINTQEVIFSVRSFLNKNLYFNELKDFIYLRNKLWTKIFQLLTIIYYVSHKESQEHNQFEMIKNVINQDYLETLCISLSDIKSKDLLEWALKNLITLIDLQDIMVSNELISKLFNLLHNMTQNNSSSKKKTKELLLNVITGLMSVSNVAKICGLKAGCVSLVMKLMKKIELKLSLEDVGSLRKTGKKKQIIESLTEFSIYLHLLNNLSTDYDDAKTLIIKLGFVSLIHKNWNWISASTDLLSDTLKTICTLTSQYETACNELALSNFTSKKLSSTNTLINLIINVILREMEFISKTHNLAILKYSFQILHNSCSSDDCRTIIAKTNLLAFSSKLHPSMTKHQKSWKQVQLFWLEFLNIYSSYPEGQTVIHRFPELLQILITISESNAENRILSIKILRNFSFCSSNKPRLLACVEFLGLISKLLISLENKEEFHIALVILWTLSANNQKAKVILKCAGLDGKLKTALESAEIFVRSGDMDEKDLEEIRHVLQILRNNDN